VWTRLLFGFAVLYVVAAAAWVISAGVVREGERVELLNVACDPTRELWRDVNAAFIRDYEQKHGVKLSIRQSHGGSGSQARAVIDGLPADVVTLALWTDTDAVRKAGLIAPGWEEKLPNRSLPYTSTIVFVVRKGNPKGIHDWPDLEHADVITPNPKTSGNGKWSFLALWGSVVWRGGSEEAAREYVTRVFRRVPVLDAAARGATMTFAQKGIGDVHLTWENEAHLEVQESGGQLEIVYPGVSVLAEPHVAVVDRNVDAKGTRAAAEAYLRFLYTEPAQELIARRYHRPTSRAVFERHKDTFPTLDLRRATTLVAGGSWDEIQKRFFAEGGEFDRVSAAAKT
jgi:sulfate transport system substrate-binding protein